MEKLKLCPFCGGKAITRVVARAMFSDPYWGVVCTKCKCGTTGYLDFNKAIESWNSRTNNLGKAVDQMEKLADKANDKILETAELQQYYDGYEDGVRTAIEIAKDGGANEKKV